MYPPSEFEEKWEGKYPKQRNDGVSSMEELRARVGNHSIQYRNNNDTETNCSECDIGGCEHVRSEREIDTCCYCADVSADDWCIFCIEEFPDTYSDLVTE